jgi:hypothetical protein
MPHAVIPRTLLHCAMAGLVAGLVACGGGGGGGAGSDSGEQPSLLAYSSGSIASTAVSLDGANGFDLSGVHYQLKTADESCSLVTNPTSARPAACTPLAGGRAFLGCDRAGSVSLVLLRPDDFQEVSWSQVNRQTLTQVTCGATGVQQIAGSTVTFRGFPGSAVEKHVEPGIVTEISHDSENLMNLFSGEGTANRHRWILYKAKVDTSSVYVLLDLYEGQFAPAQAVYVVEVP